MTTPLSTRPPSAAYFHAAVISLSLKILDCPLPEEDIVGFTKHGNPILSIINSFNSLRFLAKP